MLMGCGKTEETTAREKDTLTVANIYDAKSLDPHATNDVASSNVMQQIYNNLVTLNADNEVVPELAESYERVDETTYKFVLRQGVLFHNGEELTSRDVRFTFVRSLENGGAIRHIVGDIDPEGFECPDDYTIIIRTKTPSNRVSPLSHSHGWWRNPQ